LHLIGEQLHLGKDYRGLEGVHAPVEADPRMVIAAVLAMVPQFAQPSRQDFVICEAGAAVAVAPQRLGRKKAGAANRRHAARFAAIQLAAEALCGIFDHRQAMAFGDRIDRGQVGALAV
jgi:hypothetical protein